MQEIIKKSVSELIEIFGVKSRQAIYKKAKKFNWKPDKIRIGSTKILYVQLIFLTN